MIGWSRSSSRVRCSTLITGIVLSVALAARAAAAADLRVGFASVEITPEVNDERPIWLAGYGQGRRATGVHDPLFARTVVLDDGTRRLAIVSVDLVGMQLPDVRKVRGRLDGIDYLLLTSTHNHESPDVVGIWGPTVLQRGVDEDYLQQVIDRCVSSVRQAEQQLTAATARYGTAQDDTLVNDSRKPVVKDGTLRTLRFLSPDGGTNLGVLLQWNCHPEALGSRNQLVTADFPASTIQYLQARLGCPIVYATGAVGGLMAPPRNRIRDEHGQVIGEGNFQYARRYGVEVGKLAARAIDADTPLELSPFHVASKPIAVPVQNLYYRTAHALGIVLRPGRVWSGDFNRLGDPLRQFTNEKPMAIETEVGYLRLGELHVACIPGEIYPELVYGRVPDPAEPQADFPDAPREPSVVDTLPGQRWMLFGLANDEIGYIIPKRQWDRKPPFAYGRTQGQYGEINSCGPDVAPIVLRALEQLVNSAGR